MILVYINSPLLSDNYALGFIYREKVCVMLFSKTVLPSRLRLLHMPIIQTFSRTGPRTEKVTYRDLGTRQDQEGIGRGGHFSKSHPLIQVPYSGITSCNGDMYTRLIGCTSWLRFTTYSAFQPPSRWTGVRSLGNAGKSQINGGGALHSLL